MAAIIEEFQKSLTRSTGNTKNVRAFKGKWLSGVYKVPEEIRVRSSCIVSLLQENISEFCEKDEYLMIYNFQAISDIPPLYSLDMVIKPVSKITDLNTFDGQPLQLVVDGEGNVVNNSFALKMMGLLDEEEEERDPPICYGNYHYYSEPTPSLIATLTALKLSFADTTMSSETKGMSSETKGMSSETKDRKKSESKSDSKYQAGVSNTMTFTFNASTFAASTLSEIAPASSPSFPIPLLPLREKAPLSRLP